MNILIVSATKPEIQPLLNSLGNGNVLPGTHLQVEVCITGAGMVKTSYELAKVFSRKRFDHVLNLGIAGSFDRSIRLGEVVNVVTDCFADMGAEDGHEFLSLEDIGLQDANEFPFSGGELKNETFIRMALKRVKGITVNKVHGNAKSIREVVERFNPDVETMEGAAFFYACMREKQPCTQIRSISNYVEKRDKTKWDIPLAVESLNTYGVEVLKQLSN